MSFASSFHSIRPSKVIDILINSGLLPNPSFGILANVDDDFARGLPLRISLSAPATSCLPPRH